MVPDRPEHNWEKCYSLKSGDVFVEAGAYRARYGVIASRKVGAGGRVILIEPDPSNIAVIKGVKKGQGLGNIMVVEKAVWCEVGRMKFVLQKWPTAYSLLKATGEALSHFKERGTEVIEVEADTVDNILNVIGVDHVDLFAADVENAEVEMIKGMEVWLQKKKIRNVAIAAYHRGGHYDAITAELRKWGYSEIKCEGRVVYAHTHPTLDKAFFR